MPNQPDKFFGYAAFWAVLTVMRLTLEPKSYRNEIVAQTSTRSELVNLLNSVIVLLSTEPSISIIVSGSKVAPVCLTINSIISSSTKPIKSIISSEEKGTPAANAFLIKQPANLSSSNTNYIATSKTSSAGAKFFKR